MLLRRFKHIVIPGRRRVVRRALLIVLVFLISNAAVTGIFLGGLAQCKFDVFHVTFEGSDEKYSHVTVVLLVRNPSPLPARLPKVTFDIFDPIGNEYCGWGEFGPVDVPPGKVSFVNLKLHFLKSEATARLFRYVAMNGRFDGRVRIHFPLTLFGLITVGYVDFDLDASQFMGGGGARFENYLLIRLPSPEIDDIRLTRETADYCEVEVKTHGAVTVPYATFRRITFHKFEFDVLAPTHLVHISAKPFVVTDTGYNATFIIRFYKRVGLAEFLRANAEGKRVEGRVIGTVSVTIFDIYVPDIQICTDLSEYYESLSLDKALGTGGALYTAVSKILNEMIDTSSIRIKYLGAEERGGTEVHTFKVRLGLKNAQNWTFGFGNVNFTVVRNNVTIMTIEIPRHVILKAKGGSADVTVLVRFYKNQELHEFLREYLYTGDFKADIYGTLDVYLMGVWLRNVSTKSKLGESLGIGEFAGLPGVLPSSQITALGGTKPENVTVLSYDISQSENRLMIAVSTACVYERYPLRLSNVMLDIFYDRTYVGRVRIPEIDLTSEEPVRLINLTIELLTDRRQAVDFVRAWVSGEGLENLTLSGTVTVEFLGWTFPNVHVKVGSEFLSMFNASEMPTTDLALSFARVKSYRYVGEGVEGDEKYHELEVEWELSNVLSVELELGRLDLNVSYSGERFARIILRSPVTVPPGKSASGVIRLRLYPCDALADVIKLGLAGKRLELDVSGVLDLRLGSLNVSDMEVKTRVAYSLLDTINQYLGEEGNVTSVLQYTPESVMMLSEEKDRTVLLVGAKANFTIPLTLEDADIVLRSPRGDELVRIRLAREMSGYGEVEGLFIVELYNSSPDFPEFLRAMAYGETYRVVVETKLNMTVFGTHVKNVEFKTELTLGGGGPGAGLPILQWLNVSELFRVVEVGKCTETAIVVDGLTYKAYRIPVVVELRNTWNVTVKLSGFEFTLYHMREPVVVGRLRSVCTLRYNSSANISVDVYFISHEPTRLFLETLLREKKLNATVRGGIDIYIFGVYIPSIRFEEVVLIDLSKQTGAGGYVDLSQVVSWRVESVEIIGETSEFGLIRTRAIVRGHVVDVKLWNMTVRAWALGKPILLMTLESPVEISTTEDSAVVTRVLLFKNASDVMSHVIETALSGDEVEVEVEGELEVFLFGFNLTIPFSSQRLTYRLEKSVVEPISASVTSAGVTSMFRLVEFEHVRDVKITGELAHEFRIVYEIENPYNANITVQGEFTVLKDGRKAIIAQVESLSMPALGRTQATLTLYILHNEPARLLLKELLERRIFNASVWSKVNITVFGIRIPVNMTLPVLYDLSTQFAGENMSEVVPMEFMRTELVRVNVLGEDDVSVKIAPRVRVVGHLPLNVTIRWMRVYVAYQGERVVEIRGEDIRLTKRGGEFSVLVLLLKSRQLQPFLQEFVDKGFAIVDVYGEISFELFDDDDWTFRVSFELANYNYSTADATGVGPVVPLGFERVARLVRVRQVGDNVIAAVVEISNVFNVTIGLGQAHFELVYRNATVVVGWINESFELAAGAKKNVTIFIEFVNRNETKEFLEEAVRLMRLPNVSVRGNVTLRIFGCSLRIDLSKYSISFIPTQMGIEKYTSFAVGILPELTYEVSSIREFTDRVVLTISVTVRDSPFTLALHNVSLVVSSEFGEMLHIRIRNQLIEVGAVSRINVTVEYDKDANAHALEKFVEALLNGEIVPVNITGNASVRFLVFDLDVPIRVLNYNVSLANFTPATLGAGVATEPMVRLLDLRELDPVVVGGALAHPVVLTVEVKNPAGFNVTLGNVSISVVRNSVEIIRVIINDTYTLPSDSWTEINVTVLVFEREETRKFLEELIENSTFNATLVGGLDVSLLGLHLTNVSISRLAFYEFTGAISDMQAYQPVWQNLTLFSIAETRLLDAYEVRGKAILRTLVGVSDVPLWLEIRDATVFVDTPYGRALVVRISGVNGSPAVLGPDIIGKLNVSLEVLEANSEAVKYVIEPLVHGKPVSVNLTIVGTFKPFKNSSDVLALDLEFELKNYVISPTVEPSNATSMLELQPEFALVELREVGVSRVGDRMAHVLLVGVNVTNPFGLDVALGPLVADVGKNGKLAMRVVVNESFSLPGRSARTLWATVYVIESTAMRSLVEEFVENRTVNITISVTADVTVFRVPLTNVSLSFAVVYEILENVSEVSLDVTSYTALVSYTIGGVTVISAEELDNTTVVRAEVEFGDTPIFVTLYKLRVNVSGPHGMLAALNVTSDGATFGPDRMAEFNFTLTVNTSNRDDLQDIITALIEGRELSLDIDVYVHLRLFNASSDLMEFEFDLSFENFTLAPMGAGAPVALGARLPSLSDLVRVVEIRETGGTSEAHYVRISLNVTNPFGISVKFGNVTVEILDPSSGVTMFAVLINGTYELPAYNSTLINVTLVIYETPETHDFIESLIKQQRPDFEIEGSLDVEFLGVKLRNLSLSKLAFTQLSGGLANETIKQEVWVGAVGYTLAHMTILSAVEVNDHVQVNISLTIGSVPVYVTLYHARIVVGTPFGSALAVEVPAGEITLGPDINATLNITLDLWTNNTDALKYLMSNLINTRRVTLNITLWLDVKLFNNSGPMMRFTIENYTIVNYVLTVPEEVPAIPTGLSAEGVSLVSLREGDPVVIEGITAHPLYVTLNVTNPYSINVTLCDVTIRVLRNGDEALRVILPGSQTLPPAGSALLNTTVYIFETEGTHALLDELINEQTFRGEIEIEVKKLIVLGVELDNISLELSLDTEVSESARQTASVAYSDVFTYDIASATVLSARETNTAATINVSVVLGNIPLYVSIIEAQEDIITPYGTAFTIYISPNDSSVDVGPGVYDEALIRVDVWKTCREGVEYVLRGLLYGEEAYVDVSLAARVRLFKNSSDLMLFDVNVRLEKVPLSGGNVVGEGEIYLPVADTSQFISTLVQDIREVGSDYIEFRGRVYLAHVLRLNVTLNNTLGLTFGMGDVGVWLARGDEPAVYIVIPGFYELRPGEPVNVSACIYIFDTDAAEIFLEDLIARNVLLANVTCSLSFEIFDIALGDLNVTLSLNTSQRFGEVVSSQLKHTTWENFVRYVVKHVRILGEDRESGYTDVMVLTEVRDTPIFVTLYNVTTEVYTPYGLAVTASMTGADGPAVFGPGVADDVRVLLRVWQSNHDAVEYLLKNLVYGEEVTINVSAYVRIGLFSNSSIELEFSIDLVNMTFRYENITCGMPALSSVSLTDMGSVISIEYVGVDYVYGARAYLLRINVSYTNNINITLGFGDLHFDMLYHETVVGVGEIRDWVELPPGESCNISLYVWLLNKPETQKFLEQLLVHYRLDVDTRGHIDIKVFDVYLDDVNFTQLVNSSMTEYVEGDAYQSYTLSMFEMKVGTIEILNETAEYAFMRYNISVSNALLDAFIEGNGAPGFELWIYYDDPTHSYPVAYLCIDKLVISRNQTTRFSVIVRLHKYWNGYDIRDKLQGFLTDVMVRKNVTMDAWGVARLYLFEEGSYLYFEIPFKFNRTTYCVEDYEEALMSGEIDTSFLFDQVIEVGNSSWEFIEETDEYVKFYIYQQVRAKITIGIANMTTYGMLEPLNDSTWFLIEEISNVTLPAGEWTTMTMVITLLKGEYKDNLQKFLDAVLHEWTINIYVDTRMDLYIFGVWIHGLEAFGTRFSYIITPELIQNLVVGESQKYAEGAARASELLPLGYGTWYDESDLYGGIAEVVTHPEQYCKQPWIWKFAGLIQFDGSTGPHYNDPDSPAWAERKVFLLAGVTYEIALDWDNDNYDLDIYIYRPGTAPSEDGTGDDFVECRNTTDKPETLEFTPDVSGWWTIGIDAYDGTTDSKALFTLEVKTPEYPDPTYVNVWDFTWILVAYTLEVQGGEPNVTVLNFRALMYFTGNYINGTPAHGDIRDVIAELYIPELDWRPENITFMTYLRLWRWNRFTGTNSSLKHYVWEMTFGRYNFVIRNITLDLIIFGCHIKNVQLEYLNFSGVYDPYALSTRIEYKGMRSWWISFEWGKFWIVRAIVHVAAPRSPSWLIYTEGEMWADDDPVFNYENDPPDGDRESGVMFMGQYIGPSGDAQRLTTGDNITIIDAPTSLPSYAVFMGGGEVTYEIELDISFSETVSNQQVLLNMYVDSLYDDETQKEQDAESTVYLFWKGYGEMWSTWTWKVATETLMFWWIIYVPSPIISICSGDYLGSVENNGEVYTMPYVPDPANETTYRVYVWIGGTPYLLQQYMDSYDGHFDTSEPDSYGNTQG